PLDYAWEFGDGTTDGGVGLVSKTFSAPGTYTVRVIVNDVHQAVDTAVISVTVPDLVLESPEVTPPADMLRNPGSEVTVDFVVLNKTSAARPFRLIPTSADPAVAVAPAELTPVTIPAEGQITVPVTFTVPAS